MSQHYTLYYRIYINNAFRLRLKQIILIIPMMPLLAASLVHPQLRPMPKSPSKSVSKLLPTPPVIKVPSSNIVIPTIWSASTQACLAEKRATPDVRKEIVYTLSVMMRAGGPEATTRIECE